MINKQPSRKNRGSIWTTVIAVLCILCFPVNPLVLTDAIEVKSYPILFIIGWVTWAFGMVMVMSPIIMFPRRGGVPRKKSFVHTTRLVDSGIYSVVRHPQYTGGVYAIFLTTCLWYPHWLFGVLGATGSIAIYMGCKEEDQRLIDKFGKDYKRYMERVPGMNIFLGILRLLKNKAD